MAQSSLGSVRALGQDAQLARHPDLRRRRGGERQPHRHDLRRNGNPAGSVPRARHALQRASHDRGPLRARASGGRRRRDSDHRHLGRHTFSKPEPLTESEPITKPESLTESEPVTEPEPVTESEAFTESEPFTKPKSISEPESDAIGSA